MVVSETVDLTLDDDDDPAVQRRRRPRILPAGYDEAGLPPAKVPRQLEGAGVSARGGAAHAGGDSPLLAHTPSPPPAPKRNDKKNDNDIGNEEELELVVTGEAGQDWRHLPHSRWGSASGTLLTHSLKATGFKPLPLNINPGFKMCLQIQLAPLHRGTCAANTR
jgi:hypothetical protein